LFGCTFDDLTSAIGFTETSKRRKVEKKRKFSSKLAWKKLEKTEFETPD